MENTDQKLWRLAQKRAAFKKQLFNYLWVNLLLWALWYFTQGRYGEFNSIPWPAWCSFGWGIGLIFSFGSAYIWNSYDAVQKEYEKLKGKN